MGALAAVLWVRRTILLSVLLGGCALPSAWADPLDGGDAATPEGGAEKDVAEAIDGEAPSTLDASTQGDVVAQGERPDAAARDAAVEAGALDEPEVTVVTTAPTELPRRVTDYTLRATLDASAHVVNGEGTVQWTNTSAAPTSELWFHLYLNAFRGPDTYFMRAWGPRETPPSRWGSIELSALSSEDGVDLLPRATHPAEPAGDDTQLRVALPRPVAPGERITLRMRWRATLPELIARTGFSGRFHMVAQWFPKLAVLEPDGRWASFPFHAYSEFYADFGRYDVTLDVPRGWTLGASGARAGAVTTQGVRALHRYVADRVHDFAWTAWDGFRVRESRHGAVALRVLHPPGADRDAERIAALATGMIPAFARRFGPYPYPNLTVVIPPRGAEEAGGMEYPTLITTVGAWFAPRRARFLEYVTAHEFGHQYFYGLFASDEHRWPFLDEGLCEYATARVMEDLYGAGGDLFDIPWVAPRVSVWSLAAAGSAAITAPVPVVTGAADFATYGRYGSHVYARTATILRTAERSFGAERMLRALRVYSDAARFRHPSPDTLYEALREGLGADAVEGFVRPALESPSGVNYRVALAESTRGADGVHRGRVVVDRAGGPALPVTVSMESALGARTLVRWDARATNAVFEYSGASALHVARIDPEHRVPFDRNRLDNARVASGMERSASPLIARLAWWIGLVLDVVGP